MSLTKIDKLIQYLSILRETKKVQNGSASKLYNNVDLVFPPEFDIIERWSGDKDDRFHEIRFPLEDIDTRITSAKEHLRYVKKRKKERA